MKVQDRELAKSISITLRTGILLAVTFGTLGCLLYLPRTGMTQASFHKFQGEQVPFASLHALRAIVQGPASMAERGAAIAQIGVLLLMATPILRVVLSLVSFLREGNRLFAGITVVVLAALAFSVLMH